jgi:hypothetical protein
MGENAFSQGADVRRIKKYVMNIVEMGRVGVEVIVPSLRGRRQIWYSLHNYHI